MPVPSPLPVAIALATVSALVLDVILTEPELVMLVFVRLVLAFVPRITTDASRPVLAERIVAGICWNSEPSVLVKEAPQTGNSVESDTSVDSDEIVTLPPVMISDAPPLGLIDMPTVLLVKANGSSSGRQESLIV